MDTTHALLAQSSQPDMTKAYLVMAMFFVMFALSSVAFLLFLAAWVWSIWDLMSSDREDKGVWLVLLLCLPLLGAAVYVFAGRTPPRRGGDDWDRRRGR